MVSGIAHRGPDDRGLWSSANAACSLGHARLSVVDLSAAGHQPMLDQPLPLVTALRMLVQQWAVS